MNKSKYRFFFVRTASLFYFQKSEMTLKHKGAILLRLLRTSVLTEHCSAVICSPELAHKTGEPPAIKAHPLIFFL